MDPERFRQSPAGKVVRVGQGEAGYWAFVPNPLPPRLNISPQLSVTLSEADRALGELAGLGRHIPNPHLLHGPFVRKEAVLSSRIEGTQADIADLYVYEAGQLGLPGIKPPPPEADVRQVRNYVQALEYGLQRVESLPISLRLMRELHGLLMQGVTGPEAYPGEFRATQNWIGPPGCTLNDADFVPPHPQAMAGTLGTLEAYLHQKNALPPLVRLALIHYQFEAIHPFVDGNGRIGRLLISLLLVHWGLLPLPLLYLSAYFERFRPAYYDLLLGVSERGAWEEWTMFFLRGVAVQARDAAGRAKRLEDLRREWTARLVGTRTSSLLLRLAENLFTRPVISIPEAQRVLGVTYPSASKNVGKLVEKGILSQLGEGKYGRMFFAPEILQLIGEEGA